MTAGVSKLQPGCVWRGFYFGRHVEVCPSPSGEGGAERRVRVWEMRQSWPSSGPLGHLLPKGEGPASGFSLIWPTVLLCPPVQNKTACLSQWSLLISTRARNMEALRGLRSSSHDL